MSLPDLDGSAQYGYPVNVIPEGQADALFAAAAAHVQAMTPATVEERHLILLALRSSTIIRNESATEAEASFRILRSHLSDVPLDILEAGCRAYVNAPGPRHYPRSAGEIRAFTNRLMWTRASRAHLLRRLAEQAAEMDAQRRRLEDDPLTPETVAQIMAEYGIPSATAQPTKPPATLQDYLDIGCTPAEARKAMRLQKRMAEAGRSVPYARTRANAGRAGQGSKRRGRVAPADAGNA